MTPDREMEARLLGFERDWRRRGPRRVEDYLDDSSRPGTPARLRLLLELIGADVELRSRDGLPAPLEGYIDRFPELVSLERLPLDVVGESYRARRRRGEAPSHAEFVAAFRERRGEIRAELARIDDEMAWESDFPRRGGEAVIAPGVDGPFLSHADYRLRRMIGAGGAGKVYEATDELGGRPVAVKFLRKSLLCDPEYVRRFVAEARTVAALEHPNIVEVRGLGRTGGGSYFLVMELVAGLDLARVADGRIVPEGLAARWTAEVCDAVEYAHRRGVVHCDIKPANVLLDGRGAAKVADFGLARTLAEGGREPIRIAGTAPFMAPEQACRSWGPIDARTDVYAIGALLFTLLTGRPPYVGERAADVLADVASATPAISPSLLRPGLSGPLVDVCRRCLCKPPEGRFQSAGDVREVLRAARDDFGRMDP